MTRARFAEIENYMLSVMRDSAHDCQHVYRVLYAALDIAAHEESGVDIDILITASLLHDIGRGAQFENPSLCHAEAGGEMAYNYLVSTGWSERAARHVRASINSHRFRGDNAPDSIEAKILFDADKLDVSGAIGIARTLMYKGQVVEPLYAVGTDGRVLDGTADTSPSFFREYNYKLKNIYDRFYTKHGYELAQSRRNAAEEFYKSLLGEVGTTTETGRSEIGRYLT